MGNSGGSPASSGLFLDAAQYAGSDICAKIRAAWNAQPGNSGTIDARSILSGLTCSSGGPFVSGKYGRLLLGNQTITATSTWAVPARVQVIGLGANGPSGTTAINTIIKASSSFASSTPVLQMGNGSAQSGVVLQGITVDCNNILGCIGILNNTAQEGSRIEDVTINNAAGIGLRVTSDCSSGCVGAANSGPYRNITIQYTSGCSLCGPSTVGLQVDGSHGGQILRGFDNVTVSGNNVQSQLGANSIGILVKGTSTQIINSHVEFFGNGISVGGGSPGTFTNDVLISNVNIGGNQGGWDIVLAAGAGDIILASVNTQTSSTRKIYDSATGNQITSEDFVALYVVGHCTQPQLCAVYTTSPSVASTAPGNFNIVGNLTKGGGSFRIDHPLDPANKYLSHSFVESPDMMNIYNGLVTTNSEGLATVVLPEYFEALNRDFRYQLTVLGEFAQAIVSREVETNRFVIRTDKPMVQVSWQVTGIRQDAYANVHRIVVEDDKLPPLRGQYLHPEAFVSPRKEVLADKDLSK